MGDTTKIVESLEESGLLIIGVSETIQKITQNNKKQISWNVIRYLTC